MGYYDIAGYDTWLTTDVVSDLTWKEIFLQEWAESLIRQDCPWMDEESVTALAQHRLETGYYDTLDF
jgi:hypothetical protein